LIDLAGSTGARGGNGSRASADTLNGSQRQIAIDSGVVHTKTPRSAPPKRRRA